MFSMQDDLSLATLPLKAAQHLCGVWNISICKKVILGLHAKTEKRGEDPRGGGGVCGVKASR